MQGHTSLWRGIDSLEPGVSYRRLSDAWLVTWVLESKLWPSWFCSKCHPHPGLKTLSQKNVNNRPFFSKYVLITPLRYLQTQISSWLSCTLFYPSQLGPFSPLSLWRTMDWLEPFPGILSFPMGRGKRPSNYLIWQSKQKLFLNKKEQTYSQKESVEHLILASGGTHL